MFQKDTFRLVKKTFNRFFTLVCIVMIGVAFMMGLLATPVIQRKSVDDYYKGQNLQDIQLYSSYGFCDEDIDEIKKLEIVDKVYASKMVDAYIRYEDGSSGVARYREIDSDVNKFKLIEGRLPQTDKEALIISPSNQLNKKIKVCLDEEDEILDSLQYDEYTIVGIVESSEYLTKVKSTSNLNNLDLNTVVYLNNNNFLSEYYTTVYTTLNKGEDISVFSKDYKKLIEDVKTDYQMLANKQESSLKSTILLDYLQEIEDGENELIEEKEKGQKKLDDAKQELDDANVKLIAGQMQIDNYIAQIDSAKDTIDEQKAYLDSIAPDVNNAIKQVEQESGKSFSETYMEVSSAYGTYISLKAAKSDDAKDYYGEQITNLKKANDQIDIEIAKQEAIIKDSSSLPEQKEEANNRIDDLNRMKNDNNELITRLEAAQNSSYDGSIDTILDSIDQNAGGSIEDTYMKLTKLANAKAQIEAGYLEIEAGEQALEDSEEQLQSAKEELEKGKKEYNDGLKKYKEGIIEFNDKISDAEAEIKKAKQDLEELPDAHWIILDQESHYSTLMYKNTCNQMEAICIVMPILFFLVGALVCMTTMTRLIDEQRGQIGIFRALGFSNSRIIGKYLQYALMASLIGSIIGVFIGMASFPRVIYETWRLMYYLPPRIDFIPLDRLIISLSCFIVLMELVTYFVVKRSLIEQPAQLMRPKAPKNAKKVFLEYIPVLWNRLSFTGKITLRNLIRYKTRFFMTIIGVAGCTGLLVLGFGIKDSIADVVNLQYKDIFDYQYTVNLEDDLNIDEIVDTMESDLENDEVVPYMAYMTKVYFEDQEETINMEVMDARSSSKILGLQDKQNNDPIKLSNKGVIVSEKFAKNLKIKKGDVISIESNDGIKAEVRVDGICHMYFQHYMFMSEDLYDSIFEDAINYTNIALRSNLEMSEIENSLVDIEGVKSITNFESFIEQFDIMIEALNFIILVIIFTSGALALVVLINLTQVNISERIREIATLKVLGFRNNEVNSYIFKEIFMLTTIGAFIGLPLGKIELKFVMNVINMDMITFPTNIKLPSYLISFVITFVFTIVVLFFTRKPLRKVQMVESLKSVE